MRKFMEVGDELFALLNWETRQSNDDSVILKCLTSDEVATYRNHGEQGLSDTEVFAIMFPKPPPVSRRPSTKFSRIGDKFLAIMNWSDRKSQNDVAAMRYLDSDETQIYTRLSGEGLGDTEIFAQMFPSKAAPSIAEARVVEVDLSQLTKRHLVHLIEAKLGAQMPSLERSLRDDLEKLLMKLYKAG
jgi:hypothetical protein